MQLKLDRVSKQYKNKIAVDRISMELSPGVYGLLGANGAGKTTLMRMLCGILDPDAGEITLDGISVKEEEYRDKLGYLPQEFGCYPEFTALDFLVYIAALKGIPKARAKRKARELLSYVGLEGDEKKKVRTFSGGMRQRLGIAQVLLNEPSVIILDEPTAGLDPKERVRFRNMIAKLGSEAIVLLSTHIVSDVEYIADTILVMKDGKMIHSGRREEIIEAVSGKVWECELNQEEAARLTEKYNVANVHEEHGKCCLRLIAEEKPHETAQAKEPTLEDLYLYYFSEETEGM